MRATRRCLLLAGSALGSSFALASLAPALVQSAQAQSAFAQPTGGRVIAGSASIGQSGNTTTITQGSGQASIDWQSFNLGTHARVDFVQPSAGSLTVNEVAAGNPSTIAGRIEANGQIVLINPSGVVFSKGAEVNAASVVVATAGTSTARADAARLRLNQPGRPGAAIVNAGRITVREAGLAALVAPRVANQGVITAKLGHVVLAGQPTATLDLYGDGLLAFDVSRQTAEVSGNGRSATVLVTNSGLIRADGGSVRLSAAAADGVVQSLIDAGGRIVADSLAGHPGRIVLEGTGGAVVLDGALLARGETPGSGGGSIAVNAASSVNLASTARLDASGQAGGGRIVIGGRGHRPRAVQIAIAAGARLAADATARGNGGVIRVHAAETTRDAGTISARGGPTGGDGGMVEVSGAEVSLTGPIDAGAVHGALGSVLLDPTNLTISSAGSTLSPVNNTNPNVAFTAGGANATLTPAAIAALTGNIHLEAANTLTVASPITLTTAGQALSLEAGGNLTVNAAITTAGNISLLAGSVNSPTPSATAGLALNAAVSTSNGNVVLTAGSGGIAVNAPLSLSGTLIVGTTGAVTQSAAIAAASLDGSAGQLTLTDADNAIAALGTLTVGGGLDVTTSTPLSVSGPVSGGQVTLVTTNAPTATAAVTANPITIGGPLTAGDVMSLTAPGGITESEGGSVSATTLIGASTSPVVLTGANAIHNLGGFTLGQSNFALTDTVPLTLTAGLIGDTIDSAVRFNMGANALSLAAGSEIAAQVLTLNGGAVSESPSAQLNLIILTGSAASISLPSATNYFEVIGPLSATAGDLGVTVQPRDQTLAISGALSVPTGHTLALTADLLQFSNATLSAPGGTIALAPTSAGQLIDVYAGAITNASLNVLGLTSAEFSHFTASTLQLGSATAGAITLGGGVNPTLTLPFNTLSLLSAGPVTEGDALAVDTISGNAASFTLANAGNAIQTLGNITTAGALALTTTDPLGIAGSVIAGSVNLGSPAAISEAAGAILSAGTLTANAASLTLTNAANAIPTLGSITTTTGSTAVTTSGALTLTGTLSSGNDLTLTAGAGGIAVDAPASLPQILSLTTPGAVTQTAPITASSMTGTVGSLDFTNAGNNISSLANFTSAGALALTTASVILQFATVQGGAVTLDATNGNNIVLQGHLIGTTVDLNAGFQVQEGNGFTVQAGLLTGSANSAFFTGSANPVATLGNFTTINGFGLTDSQSLQITGRISDATRILLDSPGTMTLAAGSVLAAPVVSLTGGTIVQAAGSSVQTVGLSGTATAASLTSNTNAITGVTGFTTSAGGFALADAPGTALALTGEVSVPGGQTLSLVADAISGFSGAGGFGGTLLAAPGGTVALAPATAGLPIFVGNNASTTGLSLSTASLGAIDAATLQLGSASAGPITLSAAGQSLAFPQATLALLSGGAVSEGGSLSVGTLTGNAASLSLPGANAIATLGNFATTNGFTLTDTGALQITGQLSDTNHILLNTTGAITEASGGSVQTPQFGGNAAAVSLTSGANQISGLNGFTTSTGGFALADAPGTPLALNVPVSVASGQTLALIADAIFGFSESSSFGLPMLAAPGGTVALAPATAGRPIIVGQPTGVAVDGVSTALLLSNAMPTAIEAATLQLGNAATGPITLGAAGQSLVFPQATLALQSAGAVSEGGSLSVGTLTGSAASVGLPGANAIATLAGFSTSGGFVLNDAVALTLLGPLDAASFAITAADLLTVAGSSFTTGGGTFAVSPDAAGAGAFVQTGRTTITPITPSGGGGGASVIIQVPDPESTISLNDLQAPAVALTLTNTLGIDSGTLAVGALDVVGQGGSANLFGSVAGYGGIGAAERARISPAIDANYLLNGFVIGAQPTTITTPATTPLVALLHEPGELPSTITPPLPLEVFGLAGGGAESEPAAAARETQYLLLIRGIIVGDAPDPGGLQVLLPDISDRDY